MDLVSSGSWWRHGNGNGTFAAGNALPAPLGIGNHFEVVDMDGNGAPDIVAVSSNGGARVMLASSPGVFPTSTDYAGLLAGTWACTGYVNADTIRDVLIQSDSLWFFRGTGGGALAARVSLGAGPGNLRLVADLNADGLADFVGPQTGGQAIGVCMGTGARPAGRVGYGVRYAGTTVNGTQAIGDVDGNGAPDLLVAEFGNPTVTVLLNQTITPNVGVPPMPRPASRLAVRASPNPASGPVGLRLTLANDGPVDVDVFDLSGRRVGGTRLGRPVGPSLEVPLAGSERLAPGIYLVRVRQGAESATARVCRMR
jgi:hypothetical protein